MSEMPGSRPVVLVTGAARRVGAVISRVLHEAGHDLALHCRHSRDELDSLIDELEGRRADSTLALQADPTRFLSTVQIGITLIGVLAGAYSGATLATVLGGQLQEWGFSSRTAPVANSRWASTRSGVV